MASNMLEVMFELAEMSFAYFVCIHTAVQLVVRSRDSAK